MWGCSPRLGELGERDLSVAVTVRGSEWQEVTQLSPWTEAAGGVGRGLGSERRLLKRPSNLV